jgi:hypothetical protein
MYWNTSQLCQNTFEIYIYLWARARCDGCLPIGYGHDRNHHEGFGTVSTLAKRSLSRGRCHMYGRGSIGIHLGWCQDCRLLAWLMPLLLPEEARGRTRAERDLECQEKNHRQSPESGLEKAYCIACTLPSLSGSKVAKRHVVVRTKSSGSTRKSYR